MGSKAFFRLLFCGVCDENKVLIEMRDYLISISRTFIINLCRHGQEENSRAPHLPSLF